MYQPRECRRRCAREWQTQTNAPDDPDVVFSLQSGTTAAGHAWSGDRVGTRVELTRAKELTADAPILGLVGAVRYAQLPQRIPAEFANLPVVVDAEMELKKKAREVARQVESLGGKGGAGSEGGDPKKDAGAGGALESAEDPVVLWGVDFSKSGRHVWSRRGGGGWGLFAFGERARWNWGVSLSLGLSLDTSLAPRHTRAHSVRVAPHRICNGGDGRGKEAGARKSKVGGGEAAAAGARQVGRY